MDRDILKALYSTNKMDQINKDKIISMIESLQEELIKSESNNVSDFLYNTLCDYFMINEDDVELQDIISEATTSSKAFETLEELEDEINRIR